MIGSGSLAMKFELALVSAVLLGGPWSIGYGGDQRWHRQLAGRHRRLRPRHRDRERRLVGLDGRE